MAKTNKKSKKNDGSKKKIIITVSLVSLAVVLSIIILIISSVMHRDAAEKLNKSIYPLKYQNYVEKYCKEFDVDKCLVYGVIKTESDFDPDALSGVGAIGLMQLMPDTFTWLQNYRTQFQPDKIMDSKELYNPKLNIEYGVYLLRYLLDMYDGNYALAICSYNAGNGNIDDWLEQGIISYDNVDPDNIPFEETANYLTRVQTAMEKYRELYFPDYVYTYSKVEWEEQTDTVIEEFYTDTETEEFYNDDYADNAGYEDDYTYNYDADDGYVYDEYNYEEDYY